MSPIQQLLRIFDGQIRACQISQGFQDPALVRDHRRAGEKEAGARCRHHHEDGYARGADLPASLRGRLVDCCALGGIVMPWKYGFKSAKAMVRIHFTDKQPVNTWNKSAPNEYGFYSNVNPNVDHPRWSQAKERRLGEFFKRPTLMFNGYDQVASLYSGMDLKKNF